MLQKQIVKARAPRNERCSKQKYPAERKQMSDRPTDWRTADSCVPEIPNSPIFRIHGEKSHRIVGFVLGATDLEGVVAAATDRGIPSVGKYFGIRVDGLDRRFGNRQHHLAFAVALSLASVLLLGDSSSCGIVFEESLDLCRRMLGSFCDGIVIMIVIAIAIQQLLFEG